MQHKSNILSKLQSWLSGDSRRQDEIVLEQQAQKDNFLKDAIDGYRLFPETDHLHVTQELRQRLNQKSQQKRTKLVPIWMRYAASIIIIIFAVATLYWVNPIATANIAQEKTQIDNQQVSKPNQIITTDNLAVDPPTPSEKLASENVRPSTKITKPEVQDRTESPHTRIPDDVEDNQPLDHDIVTTQPSTKNTQSPTINLAEESTLDMALDYEPDAIQILPKKEMRTLIFVDPNKKPISGVTLNISNEESLEGISNQLGQIQTTLRNKKLEVNRIGYQPISIPPKTDSVALFVLQPITQQENSESFGKRKKLKSHDEVIAYPSVGVDSLTRYLQKITDMLPQKQFTITFTVHVDGTLSDPSPKDSLSIQLFNLLQSGPVWVVPAGKDNGKGVFQY